MESSHSVRLQLIGKLQELFNRTYPFLKIEFAINDAKPLEVNDKKAGLSDESLREGARLLLEKDIRLADDMTVHQLEEALQNLFGSPARICRKSGNFWMETRMSRHWTLKQHNDHGRDISYGFL